MLSGSADTSGKLLAERLCQSVRIQVQQYARGNRGGEDRAIATVESSLAEAGHHRTDTSRCLVSQHHGAQHGIATQTTLLGNC
jgi:hypothetical protein